MNRNVKILVCCHKRDVMATEEPYMPIHVGKALHPDVDLGIQGDNTLVPFNRYTNSPLARWRDEQHKQRGKSETIIATVFIAGTIYCCATGGGSE